MSEAGVPIIPRDGRRERQTSVPRAGAPALPGSAVQQDACPYYILYYAEASSSGVMGPMRRARYATVREAADRALEMRRAGGERPVEIRDPQDRLITCELMGWKLPTLVRPEHPRRLSATPARIA